jgi:hypothetical protein
VAWGNENILQFNLLALALLPLLPAAGRGVGPRAQWARRLAAAILVLSVLGVIAKLLPGFDQANWEVVAVAVPAHLGLLMGIRSRGEAARAG